MIFTNIHWLELPVESWDIRSLHIQATLPLPNNLPLLATNSQIRHVLKLTYLLGETRTSPDFKAVSAARTIPAIDDNGFKLFERSAIMIQYAYINYDFLMRCSVAIMQYLVSKYHLPDHWYPSELKQRAKINEFLSWYHTSMHDGASPYFFYTVRRITCACTGTGYY